MNAKSLAVVLDFDGTVTTEDVSYVLTNEFATGDWCDAVDAFERGEISMHQLRQSEIAGLHASDEAAMKVRAVELAVIRPGFTEFVGFCNENGIPLEIASSGMQLSIDAILKSAELSVPASAPIVTFSADGFGVMTSSAGVEQCETGAVCKCSRLRMQQKLGREIVYAGDGTSDICPAREAEHVLARSDLARACDSDGLAYTPFDDFHDVRRLVDSLLSR